MAVTVSRALGPSLAPLHVWHDYEECVLPGVCGNKARKLAALAAALPARRLVSHGGAQSNAMLALAALCRHHGARLEYHTRPVPKWLKARPVGNLASALRTGSMDLVEHATAGDYEAAVEGAAASAPADECLFVPQGAAWPGAEPGLAALAREIATWRASRSAASPPLDIVLPAGTGTTALYLARHLRALDERAVVHAVPCAGSGSYLLEQMRELDAASGSRGLLPRVLEPPAPPPRFAEPSRDSLQRWREAAAGGCLLDLVYGPVAWAAMGRSHRWARPDAEVLYVHTGGREGLPSMLRRYARLGLLEQEPEEALADATARAAAAAARLAS